MPGAASRIASSARLQQSAGTAQPEAQGSSIVTSPSLRPRLEIAVVLTALALHFLLTWGLGVRGLDIVPISLGVLGYAFWRGRDPAARAQWGTRRQGFAACLRATAPLYLIGLLVCLAIGGYRDTLAVDGHLLLTLLLYPLWGTAQQFLVLSLFANNLDRLAMPRPAVVAIAGVCFACVHVTRPALLPATLVLGVWCTLLFFRHRNLWPLGLAHGLLGALYYRWVLGDDVVAALFTQR